MEYLNKVFFGNSIKDLDYCLSINCFFLLVKILYWIFSSFLKPNLQNETNLDDILVSDLQKPLTNLVVIGAYGYSLVIYILIKTLRAVLVNIAYLLFL